MVNAYQVQPGLKPMADIKNIIAIASGKGGVGKSTVTSNLAAALTKLGYQVGVLDADIYGPSQPMLFGVSGKPKVIDDQFEPLVAHGIKLMSMGFLISDGAPAIWRAPMVTKALLQMINETNWGALDFLLLDLPPGTGDIQLTLAQKVPLAGAIVVTTPQDLALLDVEKAMLMFEKVKVKVLGVVENMSTHICSNCGFQEAIFGEKGAERLCEKFHAPVLAQLPLDISVRKCADKGEPIVFADGGHVASTEYQKLGEQLIKQLLLQKKDYSAKFGNIVVE